jgi:glutathionylspermidine synthase
MRAQALFSREGANISLHCAGAEVEMSPALTGEQPAWVIQQAADLFSSAHGYAVLGSWIVGETTLRARDARGRVPITMNLSRFVPHLIVDEDWLPLSAA